MLIAFENAAERDRPCWNQNAVGYPTIESWERKSRKSKRDSIAACRDENIDVKPIRLPYRWERIYL